MNGDDRKGTRLCKDRLTVALCTNLTGTVKVPLLVIGKSKRPRTFPKNFEEIGNFQWEANASAWMTSKIFTRWLKKFGRFVSKKFNDEPVCLILDNANSHHVLATQKNVSVRFLPPNATRTIQPMDAGVIAALKNKYRMRMTALYADFIDAGKTWGDFVRSYSVRAAVENLLESWNDVSATTISNCAAHVGMALTKENRPVSDAEETSEDESEEELEEEELVIHEPFDLEAAVAKKTQKTDTDEVCT